MEYIGIPSITIICYLVGEIFKILILKKKRRNKSIPIIEHSKNTVHILFSFLISATLL